MFAPLARTLRAPAGSPGPIAAAPFDRSCPHGGHRETQGAAAPSLGNIQILRGVAASAVLACHTIGHAHTVRGTAEPAFALHQLAGIAGVAVFFAISGFLMAGLIRRDDPWTFLAHRVARIFPPFLAVVALFALVFSALRIPFGVNVFALTLAPTGPRTFPLGVEWTLIYETSFYVGLFLLSCAGLASRIVPIAIGWLALLALAFLALPHSLFAGNPPAPHLLPLSSACVAFAGGLLLSGLVARGWMRPWLILPALALLAACIDADIAACRWLAGIAAVLIVGAAAAGRQVTRAGALGRGAIVFGDWSYVLYLVHAPVILLVVQYAPADASGPLLWLLCVAGALGVSALLGPLDVALYRRLRRRIDRASGPQLRRAVPAYLCMFFGFSLFASVETGRTAWREAGARQALAALPAPALASPASAERAIAERSLGLPSLRGGVDGVERVSAKHVVLGAWAFDPERPRDKLMLAAFCGAKLVGLEAPSRLRAPLAARPGLEASQGRRIGYRLKLPASACEPGTVPVALAVAPDGRLALLNPVERPVAVSEAE